MKNLLRTVATRRPPNGRRFSTSPCTAALFSESRNHRLRYAGNSICHDGRSALPSPSMVPSVTRNASWSRDQNHGLFEEMIMNRLNRMLNYSSWSECADEYGAFGIESMAQLRAEERKFRQLVRISFQLAESGSPQSSNPLFASLRKAFIRGDLKGLTSELRYAFRTFLMRNRFSRAVTEAQRQMVDLRYPWEWFPATRAMQRTIHLHVGPTNSGKTYRALQALEGAETGIYCGPLRLLAHEIYTRLLAKGKSCALLTGEEQRLPKDTDRYYTSCTVEMTPLNRLVDVAVIDEIQMIADEDRGQSWTHAFLGVQAKQVHLCGEERSVDIIQSICASIGEKCIVHRYQRLSPLKAAQGAIGNFQNLRKGDAVVAFSRVSIHGMKSAIERQTGRRCAVIYGNLPPEVRAQQAILFNEPDNDYDFLVASDAIGMGLNLEIKRIIFDAVTKHDGVDHRNLTISELRQIAGRAGRFRTARQANIDAARSEQDIPAATTSATSDDDISTSEPEDRTGYVTTMDAQDLHVIHKNLWREAKPIKTAVIFPPVSMIERFASYFPKETPLSFILLRMQELASTNPRFKLMVRPDMYQTADIIQQFPLSIYDRCVLLTAPVALREPGVKAVLEAVARCVAEMKGGHLLDMQEMPLEVLEIDASDPSKSGLGIEYLRKLEALHQAIVLYLWVSYRFPRIFVSQHLAFHVRDIVQDKINMYLSHVEFTESRIERRRQTQRDQARKRKEAKNMLLGEDMDEIDDPVTEEGAGRWNEEGHEEPVVGSEEDLIQVVGEEGIADLHKGDETLSDFVPRSSSELSSSSN